MAQSLRLRAAPTDVETYQRLLRSDWNEKTLDGALSLLGRLFMASVPARLTNGWSSVLNCNPPKTSGTELNQHVIDRLRDLAEVFHEESIPEMPRVFSTTRTRSIAQAEKTWACLIVQAQTSLVGDTGIFLDTQSLLFWCAIYCLLPKLKRQGLQAEHDCLVNAMYVHSLLAWRSQPAQLFYLQSALMSYLGNEQRRIELLQISLDLTPIEDHSHLTRATALWAELMNLGDRQKALSFLLRISKIAPPAYEEELEEMLSETLAGEHSKIASAAR